MGSHMSPGPCTPRPQRLPFCPEPVGGVILGDPGHVDRVVSELVLLDLGLQVFGLGPPGPGPRPMPCLAFKFLLLGLAVLGGCAKLMLPAQLQESPVTFLILPVCEDLQQGKGISRPMSLA